MKQVQFLFLCSLLYLPAGAQQKNISQKDDFTRFYSADYRNYLKKSYEPFNNSSVNTPAIKTITYEGKFSILKYNRTSNTQYYFPPGYTYRKNYTLELLQSGFIGTVIQSVIQEQQIRQLLRR